MENIPNMTRPAIQAIDLALDAIPDFAPIASELRLARRQIAKSEGELSEQRWRDLIVYLTEVVEFLRDDNREFSADALEEAVEELRSAWRQTVDG